MSDEPYENSVGRAEARRMLGEARSRSAAAGKVIAESRALVSHVGERHQQNHFTEKIRRIIRQRQQGSR